MGKGGRPRKDGPRYPSGQIKPQAAGITGAQLHRMRRLSKDPILETQVGRLLFLEELTIEQARVAWKIGEIYGRYDRAMGRRRAAASPSYEVGRGRDTVTQESGDEAERSQTAMRKFGALQAEIRVLWPRRPGALRQALERLCVDDEWPGGDLTGIRTVLDLLAVPLGLRGRKRG